MLGILLISLSKLFEETSNVIGKKEVKAHHETIYAMGFLSAFWTVVWFLGIILYKQAFLFDLASWPTFLIRLVLEVILAHITIKAIVKADRSTFSLIRTGSIVLLLAVDLTLGYQVSLKQMLGMLVILSILLLAIFSKDIGKKGLGLTLVSTVMAVATLSLYKYNISHYNSVEAEQLIVVGVLLLYFMTMEIINSRRNPFRLLKKKIFFIQSITNGLGGVIGSFAYLFAPASIITAAKRASAVLWAELSGNFIFRERHFLFKISLFVIIVIGIILLI